jgi:hypothetical protein
MDCNSPSILHANWVLLVDLHNRWLIYLIARSIGGAPTTFGDGQSISSCKSVHTRSNIFYAQTNTRTHTQPVIRGAHRQKNMHQITPLVTLRLTPKSLRAYVFSWDSVQWGSERSVSVGELYPCK